MKLFYLLIFTFFFSCQKMESEYNLEKFINYKLPEYKVVLDEEKISFTGEGYSLFKIKLEENNFSEIFDKVNKDNSFTIISIESLFEDGFLNSNGNTRVFIPEVDFSNIEGCYRVKKNNFKELEFSIVIFDKISNEIIYFKSF